MRALSAVVLLLSFATVSAADPLSDSKATSAQLTIRTLELAAKTYRLKNDDYPTSLKDLVTGEKPYILGGEKALLDPWGKPYQYDPAGPKNDGKKPDIWTETPGKKVIGNWPEGKK
jgi:type II secretory pathway pseudopilin PulG